MSQNYLIRFCSDLERGSMMRSETRLDFAIFQLTPTRTRCELLVSAGGVTEKLASGLLKPFLSHLRAAEEEIERGGYSIKLVPICTDTSSPNGAAWFTKGTMERFVRFVSTPEVLERVSSVESELVQIEDAINIQSVETRADDHFSRNAPGTPPSGGMMMHGLSLDRGGFSTKSRRNSIDGADIVGCDNSKWRLLRAMEARRLMLQKEQGMAFARAAAAGFDMEHMEDLITFADCFGAARLREACVKFTALCKKRQEAGLWLEEMELAAAEAAAIRPEGMVHAGPEYVPGSFVRGKDYSDVWSDVHSEAGDLRLDEARDDISIRSHSSFYVDRRGFPADDEVKRRRVPQDDGLPDSNGDYVPQGYRTSRRYSQTVGMVSPSIDELQASVYPHENLVGRPYSLSPGNYPGNRAPVDSVNYNSEQGIGFDYRDQEGGRTRGQTMRPLMPTHSPRHIPPFHPISPSSPHGRMSGQAWVPTGDDEQVYDPRGHPGSAYPVPGQQFGRSGPHSAMHSLYSHPNPNQYGNHVSHQGYPETTSNLQWRQTETYTNWAQQQPPHQHWQQQTYAEGLGNDGRVQHFGTIPNGQVHMDGRGEPEMFSNGSTNQVSAHFPEVSSNNIGTYGVPASPQTKVKVYPSVSEGASECTQTAEQPERTSVTGHDPQQLSSTADSSPSKEELQPSHVLSPGKNISPNMNCLSPLEKDTVSPADPPNRRLARRTTSPRRRSSSPLRKVQVGRSGPRRSGMVVIRNINYIASNSQDRANRERSSDQESEETVSGGEEDSLQHKGGHVRLSVQDAISLFERKRRDSSDSGSKKRLESRRGSTESGASIISDRLRKWSSTGDMSKEARSKLSKDQSSADECESGLVDETKASEGMGEEKEVQSTFRSATQQSQSRSTVEKQHSGKHNYLDADMPDMRTERVTQNGIDSQRNLPQFESEGFRAENSDLKVINRSVSDGMILPFRDSNDNGSSGVSHKQFECSELQGPVMSRKETDVDDSFIVPERGQTQGDQSERGCLSEAQDQEFVAGSLHIVEQAKQTVHDDSFIIPPRVLKQDEVQPSRRATMNMESEINVDRNFSDSDNKVSDGANYAPEDMLFIPERNASQASLGRSWNTAYDMEVYADGIEGKDVEDDQKSVVGENESPKEQKGRFYEQYREKREAKIRDESGIKRAEREAKLKAMQEILERRKEEMASRSGRSAEKLSCSAEAQLRAEKLRAFKAGLLKSKKEKEEEERKRIEGLKLLRRERIAARSSPTSGNLSASSTPRATKQAPPTPKPNPLQRLSPSKNLKATGPVAVGRMSSSPKPGPGKLGASTVSSQKRASSIGTNINTAENPLSRSVPSLGDFRKENTKPTLGRSLLNDKIGGSARIHSKLAGNGNRSKSANDAALLEANGGIPSRSVVVRSTLNPDDKKLRSMQARRSIATVTELKISPSTLQVDTGAELLRATKEETATKSLKKSSVTTPSKDAKPFLKKGSGIGPGAGPVVQKMKASLVSDTSKSADDDAQDDTPATPTSKARDLSVEKPEEALVKVGSAVSDMVPVTEFSNGTANHLSKEVPYSLERAGNGPGFSPIRAPGTVGPASRNSPVRKLSPHSNLDLAVSSSEVEEIAEKIENDPICAPSTTVLTTETVDPAMIISSSPTKTIEQVLVHHSQEYSVHLAPPSPAESHLYSQASIAGDYSAPLALPSPSPSQVTLGPNTDEYDFVLASPSDSTSLARVIATEQYSTSTNVVAGSPTASPVARIFPRLEASLSPDANKVDTGRPRRKWGSSQKPGSSTSQKSSKDGPKGFKRLLNFGRKSKNSGTTANEWISASTASEGDDDVDESKVSSSKPPEVTGRKIEVITKTTRLPVSMNGRTDLRYMGDSPDASSRASDADGAQDHGTAPRSFFSLSSFRSKGSSTYRA